MREAVTTIPSTESTAASMIAVGVGVVISAVLYVVRTESRREEGGKG